MFRLADHDFYLLKDYIEIKKNKAINFFENKNILKFSFKEKKNIKFSFLYRTNSLKKVHKINLTNMLNFKKKPLSTMLEKMNRNFASYDGPELRSGKDIDSGNIEFIKNGYGGFKDLFVEPCNIKDLKEYLFSKNISVRI